MGRKCLGWGRVVVEDIIHLRVQVFGQRTNETQGLFSTGPDGIAFSVCADKININTSLHLFLVSVFSINYQIILNTRVESVLKIWYFEREHSWKQKLSKKLRLTTLKVLTIYDTNLLLLVWQVIAFEKMTLSCMFNDSIFRSTDRKLCNYRWWTNVEFDIFPILICFKIQFIIPSPIQIKTFEHSTYIFLDNQWTFFTLYPNRDTFFFKLTNFFLTSRNNKKIIKITYAPKNNLKKMYCRSGISFWKFKHSYRQLPKI